MRPRQHTEAQIPETAQPGRESGGLAVPLMLIRSRHALLNRLLGREDRCLGLWVRRWRSTITHPLPFLSPITGSLRLKAWKPVMHPNPASHPFSTMGV